MQEGRWAPLCRPVSAIRSGLLAAAPVTDCGPLQLMPKKKKQQPEPAPEKQQPEPAPKRQPQEPAPAQAGGVAREETVPEAGAETQPVMARPTATETPGKTESAPEAGAVGGQKKKKKSRVQVALNTLRGEGVAAFGDYIEAEIGEAALLRTLVERITRAGDLGGVSKAALGVVDERLKVVDPGAVASAQGQGTRGQGGEEPEIAVIAPVKPGLTRREKELFEACVKGEAGRFRRLLRYGNVDINMADGFGTLLVNAAYEGQANIVRELLSAQGIDVNLAQQQGGTPLYLAAQQGHVKVVELLLAARGINVNLAILDGGTPLFVAAQQGHVEVVKLLLSAPGVDVNRGLLAGKGSPLLVAIQGGHVEIAELLIAAPGINVEAYSDDAATALYIAAEHNLPGIVEQLVRRGANVNLSLKTGETPLGIAAYKGHVEAVRRLLQVPGIEFDKADTGGITPLSVAADGGYKDIVRLLLRKGADPNRENRAGVTPLHRACLYGYTGIAEMLLNAGADPDAEVKDPEVSNRTSYSLAQLAGHRPIMSLLEKRRQAGAKQATLPVAAPAGAAEAGTRSSPAAGESRDGAGKQPADDQATASSETPGQAEPASQPAPPPTPLAQAQDALRQEVLGKLRADNLEPLEGIRLLEAVNASADLDSLCALYNKLAHIERHKERARRRGRGAGPYRGRVAPGRAVAVAPVFALGEKTGLDADAVEGEIRDHLERKYQRFVSQAVNDMEFGRGKPTAGYAGLWHASAGIAGVGSCSVFYYLDAEHNRIRVVGIGHHEGRASYRLDYVTGELGGVGSILHIA